MRHSEFKKKYDPITGKFTKQHIYGEGIRDSFKSFSSKFTRKKTKAVTPPAKPPAKPSCSKKAGDSIVKMLSKSGKPQSCKPKKVTFNKTVKKNPTTS